MTARNRIIVLIDFSEGTELLIQYAYRLSTEIKAKIVFVHQVPALFPALADLGSRDEIIKTEIEEAEHKLKLLLNTYYYESDSLHISAKSVNNQLTELHTANFTDWVLGGLKKSSLIKRLLLGSTLVNVLSHPHIITLAIPLSHTMPLPEKLLIAVTPKYPVNQIQLQLVIEAFSSFISEFVFFTLHQPGEDQGILNDYLETLRSNYSAYSTSTMLLACNQTSDGLKKLGESAPNSLLILQEGNRSLIDEVSRDYQTANLIHNSNIPLLILSR